MKGKSWGMEEIWLHSSRGDVGIPALARVQFGEGLVESGEGLGGLAMLEITVLAGIISLGSGAGIRKGNRVCTQKLMKTFCKYLNQLSYLENRGHVIGKLPSVGEGPGEGEMGPDGGISASVSSRPCCCLILGSWFLF